MTKSTDPTSMLLARFRADEAARSPLRGLFQTLARAAVASVAVGCGNELPELVPERLECGPQGIGQTRGPVGDSSAYLGVFGQYLNVEGTRSLTGPYVYQRVVHGEPCVVGVDDEGCATRFAAASAAVGCTTEPCPSFAVVRSGNDFEPITDREELLTLLGEIDSASEAILLAAFEGHPVTCERRTDAHRALTGTSASVSAQGYQVTTGWEQCGEGIYREHGIVSQEGEWNVIERRKVGDSQCVIGRKPAGLCAAPEPRSRSALGTFLAKAARLEAASVYAFRQLAGELLALGAPHVLVRAALAALSDELSHAREVARLARAFGGEVQAPEVAASENRSAFELALDNAAEGCVRETFGALVATYQAETARHQDVRAVMTRIAEDETRHAELSWQLAAWLDTQLSEPERRAVAAARAATAQRLQAELDMGLTREECAELGYPSTEVAASLLASMTAQLLAA